MLVPYQTNESHTVHFSNSLTHKNSLQCLIVETQARTEKKIKWVKTESPDRRRKWPKPVAHWAKRFLSSNPPSNKPPEPKNNPRLCHWWPPKTWTQRKILAKVANFIQSDKIEEFCHEAYTSAFMSVNLAFFWIVNISLTWTSVTTRIAATRARTQTKDLRINSVTLTFRSISFILVLLPVTFPGLTPTPK